VIWGRGRRVKRERYWAAWVSWVRRKYYLLVSGEGERELIWRGAEEDGREGKGGRWAGGEIREQKGDQRVPGIGQKDGYMPDQETLHSPLIYQVSLPTEKATAAPSIHTHPL